MLEAGEEGLPRPEVVGCEEEEAAEDLLRRLLALPAPELADWALGQARRLKDAGVDLEGTEAFRLAGALRGAALEDRKALARSAVSGLSELPARRRAEAVRLALQAADVAQRVGGAGVQRLLAENAGAARRLAGSVADPGDGPLPPPPPPPSFRGGRGEDSHAESSPQDWEAVPDAPPLVRNLLLLAGEAKLAELPEQEIAEIAAEVRSEAVCLADPQQLLDTVAELRPDEREQLTDTLVEVKVVPEEQRGLLQEAVRPGGYADRLASALRLLGRARKKMWIFALLPAAELLLAILLGSLPCGTPLLAWLRGDSILALGQVCCLYFAYYTLAPAYKQVQFDLVGALHRWRVAANEPDVWERLDKAVPGVDRDVWRTGGACILAFVLLNVLGILWLVLGALEILGTVAYGNLSPRWASSWAQSSCTRPRCSSARTGCSSAVLFVCNVLIGLRLIVAATLLVFLLLRLQLAPGVREEEESV